MTDPTVAYLRANQEYLRALLQKYRKGLAQNNTMKWAQKAVDDVRSSRSTYGKEIALWASDTALKEADKTLKEWQASRSEVAAAVGNVKGSRERVQSIFPEDALIPVSQLDSVAKKNSSNSESRAAPVANTTN